MLQNNKIYLKSWKFLNVEGKLAYGDDVHAWNLIRLKKEILTEYPDLKDKKSRLSYNIRIFKAYKDLLMFIRGLKDSNEPLPLMLWFLKEKIDD